MLSTAPGTIAESVPVEVLRQIPSSDLELPKTSVSIYEADGRSVLLVSGPGWAGQLDDDTRRRLSLEAVRTATPLTTNHPGVAAFTVPVLAGKQAVGAVQFAHAGAIRNRDALVQRLAGYARVIGAMVDAAWRSRALAAVRTRLERPRGAEETSRTVLAAALEASGASAALLVVSNSGSRNEFMAGTPEAAALLRPLASDGACVDVPVFGESGAAPHACLPLALNGAALGVLALAFPAGRHLTPSDRIFLTDLCRVCTAALDRAHNQDAGDRAPRYLREVVEALPVTIAVFSGPDHVLEFSNQQRVRIWGGRNPVGTPLATAYPEMPALAEAADRVFRTGEPVQIESIPAPGPGCDETGERFFDISVLPRRGCAGEIIGVMAFGIEVTAQVRARRDLEREHALIQAVLDQMPSGVIIAEAPSARILLVNSEGNRLLRHETPRVEQIEEYRSFHAIHPDGSPYDPREYPLVRAIEKGETVHQEDLLYRRGDGSTAMLAINAAPIRDAGGRIIAGVCTYHDVTERRKERNVLRRQSRLIDLSNDAIIAATADRVITGWNTGAEETYGWTASEAAGKIVHKLLQTDSEVAVAEVDDLLLREGRWEGELRHRRKDGTELVVESCQALVRDDDGRPAAILEINRDITARKRAEEALRESEQWLRFCQQATGVGLGDFDLVSGKRKCSEQLYRLYGFEPGDPAFTYETWVERIHPDDRARVLARLQAAREGRDLFEAEFRVTAPGAPERWIGAKATLFFDGGRPVRAIAAALDITERKRSEQAHYNAQKLESVGMLASGIAHDFNNLLTGILGNASLLLPDMGEDAGERLQAIMSGAQKAADLTRLLLAYAGKGRFVVREVDLAAIVRDMTDLVRVSVPRQIEFRRDLKEAKVIADAGQIQQVVMSLVMNAAEAIGEGRTGVVSVCTGMEEIESPVLAATGDALEPGQYACLEVADSGCGIDEATRARIFDPFFTTKFLGRGLGLAAVAGIMRSHKGGIRIRTAPGKGSTFQVLIPAAHAAPPLPKPGVLVVDDEETVRDFLKRVLEGRGYRVSCAADGREALAALEERPADFGLVILDAVMPVMGGGEALAAIRARRPDLKVLLTSGYSEDEVHRLFGVAEQAAFIQKPYTAQQLAEKVKGVLEA